MGEQKMPLVNQVNMSMPTQFDIERFIKSISFFIYHHLFFMFFCLFYLSGGGVLKLCNLHVVTCARRRMVWRNKNKQMLIMDGWNMTNRNEQKSQYGTHKLVNPSMQSRHSGQNVIQRNTMSQVTRHREILTCMPETKK